MFEPEPGEPGEPPGELGAAGDPQRVGVLSAGGDKGIMGIIGTEPIGIIGTEHMGIRGTDPVVKEDMKSFKGVCSGVLGGLEVHATLSRALASSSEG